MGGPWSGGRAPCPRRRGPSATRGAALEAAGRHPFASRTRFSPETWYGNETIYTAGTQYTIARTKHHGRGTEPLFGTGLRSDVRLRGDRLRAQADGPAQPPFRAQAVQRTAGGDRDLPELPREDAEGARGGRDRGAEGPPGSARGGRVPPVAERAGPVRGDPRPGGLGDAMGHGGRISRGDAMSQFATTEGRNMTFPRERKEPTEGRDPTRCPNCGSFARYDRTERALAPGLAQLSSLSSRLGLAPAFRERAAILLRRAIEAGLSRGRSMDAIVAAVVYLAAKQLGAPRGLHELAEATGVTVHRVSLTAKIIARELGVFSRASRAEDFVPRFASQLGLDARVGERALSLVAQGKDSKILEANSPVGIAAGALYLASEDLDVPLTQAQIARLTGVSEVTIRKHYRLLKDFLLTKENPSEAA